MPVFVKGSTKVLFIHVPKTAGTSVEEILVRNGFDMTYRRGGRYGRLHASDRKNGCSPQHMHAALLDQHFDRSEFDYVFTIVRHPLTRFLSEWHFRLENFARFGFRSVEDWIAHIETEYPSNQFLYDNHLRPQNEFLWGGAEVFRLEDGLPSVFNALSKKLGIPIDHAGRAFMKSSREAQPISEAISSFAWQFYRLDFEAFGYVGSKCHRA